MDALAITLEVSRTVPASPERVWDKISDVDNDPSIWRGTLSVKNLSRDGNVVTRETILAFRKSKCLEKVTLYPKERVMHEFLEGPLRGRKTSSLTKIPEGTRITVRWDVNMLGILRILDPWTRKHVRKGTEAALQRIEEAVLAE